MTRASTSVASTGFVAAVFVILPAAFVAQTPNVARAQSNEALQACARIEDEDVRLSCFDAAARAQREADASGEPAGAANGESRPSRAEPVAQESGAAPVERVVRESGSARVEPVEQDRQVVEADSSIDSFGLNEPADEPRSISVVVVNVRTTTGGTALFETEDRQVWLQTSTSTRPYPAVPFPARVERGSLRSFFLVPDEGGRAVRVRRLQ